MDGKLTELIDAAARTLSRDERRRLISELDALETGDEAVSNTPTPSPTQTIASSDPLAALRSLSPPPTLISRISQLTSMRTLPPLGSTLRALRSS